MVWGIKASFDESRQPKQTVKGNRVWQQAPQPRVLWGAREELGCGSSPSWEDRVVLAVDTRGSVDIPDEGPKRRKLSFLENGQYLLS